MELWYRYSPDNLSWSDWQLYGFNNEEPYSWNFMAENDGFYDFYSRATDWAGNAEPRPRKGNWSMYGANPGQTFYSNSSVPLRPALAWSRNFESEICAPVIADNMVYVVKEDGIASLQASTGSTVWEHSGLGYGGPEVTYGPAVVGGNAYAFFGVDGEGYLYSLDANTGEILWRAAPPYGADYTMKVLVADGVVYRVFVDDYGNPAQVVALNAQNGSYIWDTGDMGGNLYAVEDGRVYLSRGASGADWVDAATGEFGGHYVYLVDGEIVSCPYDGSTRLDFLYEEEIEVEYGRRYEFYFWCPKHGHVVVREGQEMEKTFAGQRFPVEPRALAVADGIAYIYGEDGSLRAVDTATMQTRWSAELLQTPRLPGYTRVRHDGALAVGDGRAYLDLREVYSAYEGG
ncbi:MAG: PQQ-binding-like beta-propeller repeat protein, partial [Candidatus Zixiibacteriota bacterium]